MRGDIKLGRLFSIDIKLHFTWWLVVIFLTWILASQFFPQFYPELTTTQNWIVAIACTLLLFVSVLLHELSHSFVAKMKGVNVRSITLFFFGGVANIESEDMKPLNEFFMAIAGPLFSFFLAAICAIIFYQTTNYLVPNAIAYYLFQLNLALGIFNLVPGYPLDGGRALRAIIHYFTHDLKKSTKIASWCGKTFATVLILLGVVQIFLGSIAGLWLILIGFFLYFVADLSYEQVVFYDTLSKWYVADLLVKPHPKEMVIGKTNLHQFLEDRAASKHKLFIIKKGKDPFAVLDLTTLPKMPISELEKITLEEIAVPLKQLGTLTPDQSAYVAFKKFLDSESRVLLVKKTMESSNVLGLVFKEQVMNALVRKLKFGVDIHKGKLPRPKKPSVAALQKAKATLSGRKISKKKKVVVKKPVKKTTKNKSTKRKKKLGTLPMPELPSN